MGQGALAAVTAIVGIRLEIRQLRHPLVTKLSAATRDPAGANARRCLLEG
jgi:hypothetical protein